MKPQKFKQTEIGKIPEDWEEGELVNHLDLLKDGTHNPPKRVNKGIKFIAGASDLTYRNIDFSKCTFITEEEYNKIHKFYKLKEGDILLTIVGTVGNVAIIQKEDLPFSLQRSIAILRPKKGLNNNYLFYLITSSIFRNQLFSKINPTAQPGIYLGELGKIRITFPKDPKEQLSIVSILSSLDEKIELNNKMNKTLEAIGQIIFKKWFIDEKKEEWKVSTIGKELKTILGGTPDRTKPEYWNGDINWINSGAINDFPIVNSTEKISKLGLDKSATQLMSKKTVVLPFVISINTSVSISILGIESAGNQSVLGIIPNKKFSSAFMYYYIQNKKKEIYSSVTGGAQQHINKRNVDETELIVPDKKILEKFNLLVEPLIDKILENAYETQTLSSIRDALLPKLMSGKIRVK